MKCEYIDLISFFLSSLFLFAHPFHIIIMITMKMRKEARIEDGMDLVEQEQKQPAGINLAAPAVDDLAAYAAEA